jgi:perosamine synthetase
MISWAKPTFGGNEERYLVEALKSTWVSGGPFVDRFEREFADHHESPFAIATSNGTTALHLALLGVGIDLDDEVIVPGFGFMAAANVAINLGAVPVFVDVDPRTWCIDPTAVERAITPRTRAIVAVHTYGNVCDMDAIVAIAARHNVALVEDAAEAAFSRRGDKRAGTTGTVNCFSFQATKTIATGEGGMVLIRDELAYDQMRLWHSHGMRPGRRYWHEIAGHNFRMTNLQAAIGCAQLEQLNWILTMRNRVDCSYLRHLDGIEGVTRQHFDADVDPVIWAIAVKLDPRAFQGDRDWVIGEMLARGIETRPGFYAASQQPLYQHRRWCSELPVSEDVAANVIALPCFVDLTEDEIARVCDALRSLRR